MAQSSKKKTRGRKSSRTASRGRAAKAARSEDAIALLKADHREVEGWFEEFEKTRSDSKKHTLASKICLALTVHAAIEEEIFYPAFLEATDETDLHHEAAVEHDGAKKLIREIEAARPEDEYFDAKVTVLSEMIKHHVKEEEQRGGMFTKARQSDMDLEALGEQLKQRKQELMSAGRSANGPPARGRRERLPAAMLGRNGRGSQPGARAR